MGGIFKSIAKIAPIAAAFIPGVGPLAGAAIGAAGGALSGGGLKGALLGGVTGGLGAGGAKSLLGAGGALGTNLSGVGLKAASGALTGAAGGAYTGGGLKSALIGGGLGGLAGGLSGLAGDSYGAIEAGDKIGASGFDKAVGNFAQSGIGQSTINGVNSIKGVLGGGASAGGGSSTFSKLAAGASAVSSLSAQSDMEDALKEQQLRSEQELAPYLQSGKASNARLQELLGLGGDPNAEGYGTLGKKFSANDFQEDPGYQFAKNQGEQALDRTLGARGKVFSGEALKEAANFNEGLANQSYNDSFNRWRQEQTDLYSRYAAGSNAGQQAAGSAADIYDNEGNIAANADLARSNIINGTLSSVLGGSGQATIVGYKSDGTPIYANEKTLKLVA